MNLKVGQEISCQEVKDLENFHWKRTYDQISWEKEKTRLEQVVTLIQKIDSRLEVRIVGFGADTTKMILEHPTEPGKPDLDVYLAHNSTLVMKIEVSGTENMRGSTFWVRPDKLAYAQKHDEEDVWIVLHYAKPEARFVFIKPDAQKRYNYNEKTISGSVEHYVEFSDQDQEVVPYDRFVAHIQDRIAQLA